MVDIQSPTAENRRGKKKKERKKPQLKNRMASHYYGNRQSCVLYLEVESESSFVG